MWVLSLHLHSSLSTKDPHVGHDKSRDPCIDNFFKSVQPQIVDVIMKKKVAYNLNSIEHQGITGVPGNDTIELNNTHKSTTM